MTFEIALVFLIIGTVIILFAFEVFPIDKIAFCIIGLLVLFGLITPEEAISGFSNSAVITILCLMILAAALERNGVISWMANGLKKFKGWPIFFIIPAFMIITGSISAFISSTAVVIIFIKIITELSDKHGIPKSKLLLPISFASILGGSCTLMGTSTNLIVNSIYSERTDEHLEFFEFSWLGCIFLLASILLITLLARFLPRNATDRLQDKYDLDSYITTIELAPGSNLIDKKIKDTFLEDSDIVVLKFNRTAYDGTGNLKERTLNIGDRLMLSCNLEHLLRLKGDKEIIVSPNEKGLGTYSQYEFRDKVENDHNTVDEGEGRKILVEMMMMPGARFLGKTLGGLKSTLLHDAIPLAIKKRKNLRYLKERIFTDDSEVVTLKVGDRVLLEIEKNKIKDFDLSDNVAILQQYEAPEISRSPKRNLTLFILLGVIALAATGKLDILTSTIMGCVALLLLNCIELENAYKKINWQILFLLAGMIPLGVAMHKTGADDWLSSQLLELMQGQKPVFSIGILYLITMLLSGVISNNATAIIMAPIAISLALGMHLPEKPFILAVVFAANFSFFTPVGYQTNSLIYSMGIYKFRHFFILGGVLSIMLLVLGTFLLSSMI